MKQNRESYHAEHGKAPVQWHCIALAPSGPVTARPLHARFIAVQRHGSMLKCQQGIKAGNNE
jgi:hypothetical protein